MESKYDLDSLIETFQIHAEKSEAQRLLTLEAHPESEWAKDDFNISKALLAMCEEIEKLKYEE